MFSYVAQDIFYVYMTFMCRSLGTDLLCGDFLLRGHLAAETFRYRDIQTPRGSLQQISVFALSLNLN